ncbi:hypothetical protein [Paenibacillus sp. MMS18-CY102]|uniref:hypothetical protein n=1 Tax=Paenibacillus sp. MMS18-CY102 TaxID=2682849 RepID=UPI0013652DD2|nr:hypothetical protein [Paenibacillus sp. MMS18-CY102]MWC29816.1 hypothetical protein [Paenibacillus sp. MMS18-CY102]
MKKIFIMAIVIMLSGCTSQGDGYVSFESIYKGDLAKINKVGFLDLAGSGQEFTVENKDSIKQIVDALNKGKYKRITLKDEELKTGGQLFSLKIFEGNKAEETLSLFLSADYVTINQKEYSIDKDTDGKLRQIYASVKK